MSEPELHGEERLFIDRMAAVLGFRRVAKWLPGDIYPPFLYLGTFLVLDFIVVNMYIQFNSDASHVLLDSPWAIVAPLGLCLAAFGIRYLSMGYKNAVENFPLTDNRKESTLFERLVSYRIKIMVYIVTVVAAYAHIVVNVGIGNIIATEGAPSLVNWLIVWQVGYLPFVVEFTLIYFSIHVLVPRRIAKADIPMFFYATRNMGGFAPIGKLLKYSYYLFTAGLLLYFVLVYGAVLFSYGATVPAEPGLLEALFFSMAWVVGVASIAYSMLRMHRVMANKKEQRIAELEAEMAEEVLENPYDINNSEIIDKDQMEHIDRRRQEIRDTRVYPASFTMWSQIGLSVLLPQALNIAVQAAG